MDLYWVHAFTNRYTLMIFWQDSCGKIRPKVGESQRMAITYVHNLEAEQEETRPRIQTHIQRDLEA